jgi:Alpha/beta hydrolase of unknown function (DUF900)
MKRRRLFAGILFTTGLIAGLYFLHAQDATIAQSGTPSVTDTNVDWNSLSDAQIELMVIEQVSPTPYSELPEGDQAGGTFWSAQHSPVSTEPFPPFPADIRHLPVWNLSTNNQDQNVFLLDDLSVNYNSSSTASSQTAGTMQPLDSTNPPSPGGGGTNSGGGYTPGGSTPIDTNGLWLQINGVSNGLVYLTLNNTTNGVQYQLLSQEVLSNAPMSSWDAEGSAFWGSETTNWTAVTVPENGRTNLFLAAQSWASSGGNGVPDWWEILYYGHSGIDVNAQDGADDGWTIYQKYAMGVAPNTPVTPPAPQGVTVNYNSFDNTAAISWLPSPGPVTGYTVEKTNSYARMTQDFNVGQNVTSLPDDVSSATPNPFDGGGLDIAYRVQAHYSDSDSSWSGSVPLEPTTISANIVAGSQDTADLETSALPTGTTNLLVTLIDQLAWENYEFGIGPEPTNPTFEIGVANPAQDQYLIPTAYADIAPPSDGGGYSWYAQTLNTNGNLGAPAYCLDSNGRAEPPYFDGRVQLKQNLIFLLRAAMADNPFGYYVGTNGFYNPGPTYEFVYPNNYVYSGFYQMFDQYGDQLADGIFDPFLPFENNYFFRNFVFNLSDVSQGYLNTGIYSAQTPYLIISNSPVAYLFQPPTTNETTIPALLSTNETRWLAAGEYMFGSTESWGGDTPYGEIGVSEDNSGNFYLGGSNYFGLPFLSVEIAYGSGSGTATTTLNAGGSTSQGGYFYSETAQPQFQTVGYDFWNLTSPSGSPTPLPGTTGFSETNPSDLLIVGVPGNISVAGYAKLALANGYPGVYAYLGQYFTNAYQIDDNGNVTTNTTGLLSPYGQFFATQPGPAALVTMPDVDTGERGTGIVYAISLALDANHDGVMNTSFSGPDTTSPNSYYQFWVNNNYDRWDYDPDDGTNYMDDVQAGDNTDPAQNLDPNDPDCNYTVNGNRVIPDTRDLEDFARLWVCGVTSNLLASLPAGSTVTLSWLNDYYHPMTGSPTIDLFLAADSDGGIGYLTNATIAAEQTNNVLYPNVARLAPGSSLTLNGWQFTNGWVGSHFIWCGVVPGSGALALTIADASNNVLAQSVVYIQLQDIKQMYERYTVGDNPTNAPYNVPEAVADGLPADAPTFHYSWPTDTNTPYILFVHGWNLAPWEKDRFAETAFKRLYWQGYQGRFGEFRWPTDYGFNGPSSISTNLTEKDNFDGSEYQAWQSGAGLLNLLTVLDEEYQSSNVYLLAHSLGNVVAGEALRLAGNDQVVNTYVATQAAVTAHTYDTNVSNYSFYYPPWSYHADTPNIYGNWFAGDNGGGAGQVISFYNTNDYALQRSAWQLDQLFKPDQGVLEGTFFWNYGYNGSTNDPPPWNHFSKLNTDTDQVTNFDIVNSLNNRYEVMGYAAQSYTTALGATPGVHNVAQNVDLTTLWPSPDPLGKNYASHFYHSAEFRGDSVWEWNYWNTLLFSPKLGFNIINP